LTVGLTHPTHHVRIKLEAKQDLKTWCEFLQEYNGVTIIPSLKWRNSQQISFETDASSTIGFGGRYKDRWFSGTWPTLDSNLHINILELYAVMLAIAIWGPLIRDSSFELLCDNQSVVSCLNKQTYKDKEMMRIIREIVLITLKYNI
jgi:hypothetical protein